MTGRAKSATCCPTPTDIDLNDPAAVATAELLIAEIESARRSLHHVACGRGADERT
jgi:hypothetical protein